MMANVDENLQPAWRGRPGRGSCAAAGIWTSFAALSLFVLLLIGRVFFGGIADWPSTHGLPGGDKGGEKDVVHASPTKLAPPAPTEVSAAHESSPRPAGYLRDSSEYVLSPSWDARVPPTTRYYNWTVSEVQGNPDGGPLRTLIVINAQFPGPVVECNEGDTLIIDVHNQGTNSTSIHWHGQYQNGTNWMDGTVGVTNCPIPPGESFRYKFTAQNQRGTYWYHAHFSTTRIDGLFGPLVIHSPHEVVHTAYDTDRIVMLHDYYRDLSSVLLKTYLASDNENAEPIPNGALINGRAQERIHLERDKSHRLRFINVGAFSEFDVELDRHEFDLIEVDGMNVEPYRFHRFKINAAQRYSVVLRANKSEHAYWLRARMIKHCFASIPKDLNPEVKAIVQYTPSGGHKRRGKKRHEGHEDEGEEDEEEDKDGDGDEDAIIPTTSGWGENMELICKDMNTTELVPAPRMAAPAADILIPLRSNFEIGAWRLSRGFFNQTSWRPSTDSPTLVEAVAGLSTHNASFTDDLVLADAYDVRRQLVVNVPRLRVVDLLVENFDDGDHPLHLHGTHVWVLAQGHGYFDMAAYASLDVSNPLRRDTVTVEAFGWVLIRFVADNPGMWAMHCHIAWHVEAGMLMQFLVGAETMREWTVPEEVSSMCAMSDKQRGGGYDDEYFMHH